MTEKPRYRVPNEEQRSSSAGTARDRIKDAPLEQHKETEVTLTEDELLVLIEELSHRPYREVFQLIAALGAKIQKARSDQGPQIVTK